MFRWRIRKILVAQSKDRPAAGPGLPAASRRDFIAQFRDSNALMARKWFREEDGALFPPAYHREDPNPAEESSRQEELVIDVLIDSLIVAVSNRPRRRKRASSKLLK